MTTTLRSLTCTLPDGEHVIVTFDPLDDDREFLVQWEDDLSEVPANYLDTANRETILHAVGQWLLENNSFLAMDHRPQPKGWVQ